MRAFQKTLPPAVGKMAGDGVGGGEVRFTSRETCSPEGSVVVASDMTQMAPIMRRSRER